MDRALNWWGFRLRNPSEFGAANLKRMEVVALFLSVATVLQFVWLLLQISGIRLFDQAGYVISPALAGLAVGVGLLLPQSYFTRLPGALWLVLARERGEAHSWDIGVCVLALLGLGFSVFTFKGILLVSSVSLFTSCAVLSICLRYFQKPISFALRRWQVKVPSGLEKASGENVSTQEETEEPDLPREDPSQPDPGAAPVYTFNVGAKTYLVGIHVLENLLQKIQGINAEAQGRLYQNNPAAVVLADRSPADGLGQQELIRFCKQVQHATSHHKLTPLQVANLVLRFVQEAFTYKFDIDSTEHVPGGPYEEYGRFAVETICDQHGDCECTSILCASLLAYLGYDTALLFMTIEGGEDEETTGHCAVGINAEGAFMPTRSVIDKIDYFSGDDGSLYLYGETATDTPMAFGSIPLAWKGRIKNPRVEKIPSPNVVIA